MKALRNLLNTALNLLAGLSLTAMVILTTYQVITRYVFNAPSTWSEELVGYLFAWSTLFGAAIVSGERGHMNIPILVDKFNPPVGNTLFVGIKIGRTTLAKVMPYMLMYYVAIIAGLLLVTYVPSITLILPQLTGLV